MRPNIRHFIELAESIFNLPEPIYEFGSYQIEGQEDITDLRPIFLNKIYVGCDMRAGKGVDRIENVESPSLPSGGVGTVIFVETIEHVKNPSQAIKEIYRILKPNGVLVVTSGLDLAIHAFPGDYWRFTSQGFRLLLSSFPKIIIGFQGYSEQLHTVFGIGFKGPIKELEKYFQEFVFKAPQKIKTGSIFKTYKVKAIHLLQRLPIIKRRAFLSEVLKRYLSADNIKFELIDNLAENVKESS